MKHLLGIAALACAVATQPALGNTGPQWPERPIRLVVPFPAGGPTDIAARVVGKALADRLTRLSSSRTRPARTASSAPATPRAASRTDTR